MEKGEWGGAARIGQSAPGANFHEAARINRAQWEIRSFCFFCSPPTSGASMSQKRRHRPRQRKASRKAAIARGKRIGKAAQNGSGRRAMESYAARFARQGLSFAKKAGRLGFEWIFAARKASAVAFSGAAACMEKKRSVFSARATRSAQRARSASGTAQEAKNRLASVVKGRP